MMTKERDIRQSEVIFCKDSRKKDIDVFIFYISRI